MALKRFNGNPEYFYDTVGDTHELTDNDIIPFTHKPGTADDEDGKVKLSELKKYTNTTQNARLTVLEAHDTQHNSDISAIQAKIPADASSSNKLVTKEYVDDEISTNTATFRGNFATKAALNAYTGEKDNNDYAVVTADETHSNQTWRYKYDGTTWVAEYKVNDTALTTAQTNALNSGITSTLVTKLNGIATGAEVNVQSDWSTTDTSADSYIKNKPANLVQDANYVHTDNNFTTTEKNKLSGIATGAEVNVQSDWNQTDSTKDDYIKNKPAGITVVDSVANGNMNAVTSNAVYDALHAAISWNGSVLSITI